MRRMNTFIVFILGQIAQAFYILTVTLLFKNERVD